MRISLIVESAALLGLLMFPASWAHEIEVMVIHLATAPGETEDAEGIAVVRPSQAGNCVLRVNSQKPAAKGKQQEYDVESYNANLRLETQP